MGITDDIHHQEELDELRRVNARLMRRVASKDANEAQYLEVLYRAVKDAAVVVGQPPRVNAAVRDRRKGAGEVAVLHTTDWQLGKRCGLPGSPDYYDADVCEARIRYMLEKVGRITEVQRADHPVREFNLLLGGDLSEGAGNIFPGQAYEVDSSRFEQLFRVANLIEHLVRGALEMFEEVTVDEVPGNHGRPGRKGDAPKDDNMDLIAGKIARDRIGSHPRLRWDEPSGWHRIVEVGKYRAILVHGDQVKSFGGNLPAFGIMRKATAWASGVVPDFADLYMGHFHSEMTLTMPNGGRVYMTPSTESGSEYAREFVAAKGKPAQRLHFVDPVKGRVTAQYMIDLGGIA